MGVIVKGANVPLSKEAGRTSNGEKLIELLYPKGVEATSLPKTDEYLDFYSLGIDHPLHGFLLCLQTAFSNHKGIYLSPDAIWLLICQGFAEHIKQNSEYFKGRIKGVEERQTLRVTRNDFVKGEPNPWQEVFPAFADEISKVIGPELQATIAQRFSTTSTTTAASFDIAFMDSMSNYFDYELRTLCGIPEIIIEGHIDDYQKILEGLKVLGAYELEWWTDIVAQHVQKIIDALLGEEDQAYWNSIFKKHSESGGPYISGWITDFFPYLSITTGIEMKMHESGREYPKSVRGIVKNKGLIDRNKERQFTISQFPSGISNVPLKWKYLDQDVSMSIQSGFIGILEDQREHCLRPEIHWVVLEEETA